MGHFVRNYPHNTRRNIRDYFKGFLSLSPVAVDFEQAQYRVFGDIGMNSGCYTFRFSGGRPAIAARYSYAYQLQADGRWLIVDHHSSQIPH